MTDLGWNRLIIRTLSFLNLTETQRDSVYPPFIKVDCGLDSNMSSFLSLVCSTSFCPKLWKGVKKHYLLLTIISHSRSMGRSPIVSTRTRTHKHKHFWKAVDALSDKNQDFTRHCIIICVRYTWFLKFIETARDVSRTIAHSGNVCIILLL